MQGTGKTVIASGGTLAVSSGTHQLNRILENDGTATWTAGAIPMRNGTINNNASWTANSASTLQCYGNTGGGVNAFNNNAGSTFTQMGAGTTQFIVSSSGVAFNNAGTVNVNVGELDLSAGGTQTSAFTVASGATLLFNGTHSLSAASTGTGLGTITVAGGTSTFS